MDPVSAAEPPMCPTKTTFSAREEVVTDEEAKEKLWSISQKYDSLLKLQREYVDAQAIFLNAEGHRLKVEARALSADEGMELAELLVEAQKHEREAKLEVLRRRVRLLQSLEELRQTQLQDLYGLIDKPADVVWQDDRCNCKQPQQSQSPASVRSEAEAEGEPGHAALRAELESLHQRERELMGPSEPSLGVDLNACDDDICQRLAKSEHNLTHLLNQAHHAKRLAEDIAMKQRIAESQAIVAADLLQAAMEVQDEVSSHGPQSRALPAGSRSVPLPEPAETAESLCSQVSQNSQAPERPRPSALAPELLSLVMEEVGLASEQLATLSPWRSAFGGDETPSTHVHSLSEAEIPHNSQVLRQWQSPAEESTVSTSLSPCRISPPTATCDPHTDGIDLALAAFLSPRRNRLRRSLFSREGHGLYRYGTCQLRLRFFAQGELEASGRDVETWEPLEDFLRKVEIDQSQRLRRARERAKVLRKS